MVDNGEYFTLNDTFQHLISGSDEDKSASEGYFPHFLPLKEIPLICPSLFIFHINKIVKQLNELRISLRR